MCRGLQGKLGKFFIDRSFSGFPELPIHGFAAGCLKKYSPLRTQNTALRRVVFLCLYHRDALFQQRLELIVVDQPP
jgi:hypothetical protein